VGWALPVVLWVTCRMQSRMGALVAAKKILVVEDIFLIADQCARLMIDRGFTIIGPVATADDALREIGREKPDCVLLDVNLREGSALAVAQALRKCGTPFVVVTGYRRDSLPSGLQQAPYVPKPMREDDMIETVARACGDNTPASASTVDRA
jgi:DNA-binding NtrC family response regulator